MAHLRAIRLKMFTKHINQKYKYCLTAIYWCRYKANDRGVDDDGAAEFYLGINLFLTDAELSSGKR